MSVLTDLLALQKTDIAISQARHRLAHLPQLAVHKEAVSALAVMKQQIATAIRRRAEAQVEITQLEDESHQIDIKAARLKKQLRTVIAAREAEALQHEIANCDEVRGSLDDREFGLLELVEQLASEIESLTQQELAESERITALLQELHGIQAAIRQEVEQLEERRSAICLVIPDRYRADYESKRKHIAGGAVAELHGPTCQSCHLDISRGELATMKALPADEFPECPNCGSYLVI